MIRSIALSAFAAFITVSANAACPGSNLKINDLIMTAEGRVLRTELVEKRTGAQNKSTKLVSVVRDSISLAPGDNLTLNSALTAAGIVFITKVSLEDQEADAKGIFSTTYRVTETMPGGIAGPQPTRNEKTYLAKVVSNYAGEGTYNKGCGEVLKTDMVDTQTTPLKN